MIWTLLPFGLVAVLVAGILLAGSASAEKHFGVDGEKLRGKFPRKKMPPEERALRQHR